MIDRGFQAERRRVETDLTVIVLASLASLLLIMAFNSQIMSVAKDPEVDILLRTLLMAVFQFGIAGLGISIVAAIRKESFVHYGLTARNLPRVVALTALAVVPYLVYRAATGTLTGYMPFRQVNMTAELLASGFPRNVLGMSIVAVAWGFFEGFNYAVISNKINTRYPSKNVWLNWGAILCGVLCLLIHGMVGVTPDALAEAAAVFFIIYWMLIAKSLTGNAWGTVLLFIFFWNAI
ncbi:MAG: hypothetical protein ACM3WU_07750 [Bacillota bacterium]